MRDFDESLWFAVTVDSMGFLVNRLARERSAGEAALCDSALDVCEAIVKHTTAILVACIPTATGREERYTLEHRLLRASGVGEWGTTLQTLVVGHLNPLVQPQLQDVDASLSDISKAVLSGDWRHEVVLAIDEAMRVVGIDVPQRRKTRLLDFFVDFAKLRNKLDAHGAPPAATKSLIGRLLEPIALKLIEQLIILQLPLVSVRKDGATGSPIAMTMSVLADDGHLELVRRRLEHEVFRPGAYVVTGDTVTLAALVSPSIDGRDVAYANGYYRESDKTTEFLSYSTGAASRRDVEAWCLSPRSPRRSETAGLLELECRGESITNAPVSVQALARDWGLVRRASGSRRCLGRAA